VALKLDIRRKIIDYINRVDEIKNSIRTNSLTLEKSQMANIKVSDIRPAGSELFSDSENFMRDLNDSEMNHIEGGFWGVILRTLATILL
jgi:hypothetical protein